MSSRNDMAGAAFGVFAVLPSVAAVITAVGVIAHQCSTWLKTASWPPLTVNDGLSWWMGHPVMFAGTGALGVDEIIRWFLAQPLSISLFMAALVYMYVAGWLTYRVFD